MAEKRWAAGLNRFANEKERNRAILVGAMVLTVVLVVILAWAALLPFVLGLIVAYIVLPAVDFLDGHAPKWLQKRGASRPIAIVVVYLLVIGFIAGILAFFIPAISQQAKQAATAAPGYFRTIADWYEQTRQFLRYDGSDLWTRVPEQFRVSLEASFEEATQALVSGLQKGVGITLQAVFQTVSFVLGMIIVPFWLFYVLRDKESAVRAVYQFLPESLRDDVRCIVCIVDELLSAYVRGQLLLCLVVGGLATITCFAVGLDLALLLGTIAGILEVIPFLGPWLGAIPAVLVALAANPILALWVAIAFAAIQQVENIFLVPRITGSAVRFHPAVVMVLVVIGSELAGIWGVLMVVPLSAVLRDVYQYLYLRTTDRGATPEMALEALQARAI